MTVDTPPTLDIESIYRRFDDAWQSGTPPQIEVFFRAAVEEHGHEFDATTRRDFLEELICIDLEYRWKSAPAARLHVEDYARLFADEWGSIEELPVRLIAEEYRVRRLFGDGPMAADYLQRFQARAAELITVLAALDDSLPTRIEPRDGTTSRTLPRGARIGSGYDIMGVVGRGGMGIVYKARQRGLNRLVALKMILSGAHAGQDHLDRFRAEAEAVARAQHPNIVQIYEIGEHEGQPFFSMEFVEAGSLAKKIGAEPQPARESAARVEVLARAIHAMHQCGIVHRDLKPANVLIRKDGQPVITDFGLAKQLDDDSAQTRTGAIMGTPSYMAPEQASGKTNQAGPLADVYALGAMLYHLLTGRPPFKGETPLDTLEQVRSQAPVPPTQLQPKVPRDLETICLKCLEKVPNQRYATALELADDLGRFLKREPIKARPVGRTEKAVKWVRRNPTVAALLAAFVLALLGGVTGIYIKYLDAEANAVEAKRQTTKVEQLAFLRLRDAAQSALRRGQLVEALKLFDDALPLAPPDERRAIEVERLRCLFAFGHWDDLKLELDRLSAGGGLTNDQQAQVLLHRGDLGLTEWGEEKQQSARKLITEALAVPQGLPAADAAYARGVLTDSSIEACAHFEEALRHDRFHLRANGCLLTELVLTGQFAQARQRAEFMAAIYPGEPVVPLALTLMTTIEENVPARERHRAELRRLVADPQRMVGFDAIVDVIDEAIRANHEMHDRKATPDWVPDWLVPVWRMGLEQMLAPPSSLQQLKHLAGWGMSSQFAGTPAVIGVGLPVLMRPQRMFKELVQATVKFSFLHDYAGAAALCEKAEQKYPESFIRLLHAWSHAQLAGACAKKNDLAGWLHETQRAHDLAEQAATAPTLLPFGPYRRDAHWLCLIVELDWALFQRNQLTQLAMPSGTTNPLGAVLTLVEGQARLRNYPLPKDSRHLMILAADRTYDENRAKLLPLLVKYLEVDEARLLLLAWIESDPTNPAPLRHRAEFELKQGNGGEARRWAEQGLARFPKDTGLRRVRDRAIAAPNGSANTGKPSGQS